MAYTISAYGSEGGKLKTANGQGDDAARSTIMDVMEVCADGWWGEGSLTNIGNNVNLGVVVSIMVGGWVVCNWWTGSGNFISSM